MQPVRQDLTLAHRAASGDEQAVRALLARHNQRLFRTARAILRDDAEAEEAVQDAWLKALRGMETFREEARLTTWLTRIVANEALTRLRRRKRSAEVVPLLDDLPEAARDAVEPQVMAEDPQRESMRSQFRRIVERRIDGLPDAYRAVFVLRAVEEMTVEETAQALGIPEPTVRTRFFRARGLLRESIARDVDGAVEEAFGFAGERCQRIADAVVRRLATEG